MSRIHIGKGWGTGWGLAPNLAVLVRGYDRSWVRGDVVAGLTVLAYLIPQVLAYSGLIGLPPVAGLITSVIALVVYALLGSARIISVGPESTVALMTGLIIAPLAVGRDAVSVLALTGTLTLVVGFWLLVAWLFRLGAISALLSKPILIGYLAGSAILMVVSQLGKVTKTSSSGETVLAQLEDFVTHASGAHLPTVWVCASVLVFLFVVQHFWPRLPVALLAIGLITIASYVWGLEKFGVDVLGSIPQGLPTASIPLLDWSTVEGLLFAGLGVAIVVYSDVMLNARAFSDPRHRISPNSELLAMSGVHVVTAFAGGYPSSASGSRTAIGKASGAHTQLHALVAAAGVAVVLLVAGPLFYYLPKAALAAVVVWAATKMIAFHDYKYMWQFRRSEYAVAGATALGTAVFGILPGIGIAVGLSVIEMLMRLARPHEAIEGMVPGLAGFHDVDDYDGAVQVPGLLIYRYDAPLFFGNAEDFQEQFEYAVAVEIPPPARVILNMEANMHIDFTAAETLRGIIKRLRADGVEFGVVRLKHDLRIQLEHANLMEVIGEDMVFLTLPTAIKSFERAHPEYETPLLPKTGEPFVAGIVWNPEEHPNASKPWTPEGNRDSKERGTDLPNEPPELLW